MSQVAWGDFTRSMVEACGDGVLDVANIIRKKNGGHCWRVQIGISSKCLEEILEWVKGESLASSQDRLHSWQAFN